MKKGALLWWHCFHSLLQIISESGRELPAMGWGGKEVGEKEEPKEVVGRGEGQWGEKNSNIGVKEDLLLKAVLAEEGCDV